MILARKIRLAMTQGMSERQVFHFFGISVEAYNGERGRVFYGQLLPPDCCAVIDELRLDAAKARYHARRAHRRSPWT